MKHRLTLAAAVLAAVLAGGIVSAAEQDYADQKVVYHNSGGEPGYFTRFLGNISNHLEAVGEDHVQIIVVDHGAGLDLFDAMAEDPKIAKRVDMLRGKGVRFLICQKTLDARHVDWRSLPGVQETDVVPSGVAEIAKLQGDGFAYIHP